MVAAITLTPDNGIVGATITIDGTGFTATEDITLTYGGNPLTPVAPISTIGDGSFSGTFIVPASVQGIHSVVATDETLLTDDANFTVNSNLVITESNITVGGTINFTGTGFAASEDISFTFSGDSITPVAPVSSNATGGFTGSYVVEAYPNGSTDLVATDETLNTDTDSVIIDARLVITESDAQYGDVINLTGTGFTASEVIDFTFDGGAVTVEEDPLSSDADGSFVATFTIPAKDAGSQTIAATDQSAATDSDTINIIPLITLDDSSGSPGEAVVITGHGFTASDGISFTFNGEVIVADEDPVSSDADGEFTATINVPTGVDDSVTIVATDDTALTDSATFTVILASNTEITLNVSFEHLNGINLNNEDVAVGDSVERSAVVDVPFASGDRYSTGGMPIDFSGIQGFTQVYVCKVIHNTVGLECSFVPGASNDSTLGKIKFWGTDGNELADNSSSIASKTLTVEIRGI